MENIYVIEQGCKIKRKNLSFVIQKEGVFKEEIQYHKLEKIFLFGNQSITPKAVELALDKNIEIVFLSMHGKFKGKLEGSKSKNIYLRLAQYEKWRDKENRLEVSKIIIENKIKNQKNLLKNYGINKEELEGVIKKVRLGKDIDEIMGYEGMASKIYFGSFKKMIKANLEFNGRNRRPPKDEINALLSLTYSMVLNEIIIEIEKESIDGYLGNLHSVKYGRESLALDILEEFRQSFCDKFVLKLINRKEIKKEDFTIEDGYKLKEKGFRKYISKYNLEIEEFREKIKNQIKLYKKSLIGKNKYKPYGIKILK
ncbi:MAG: CRISPR-associated endonuclease Cas1 [Clostridium sp.]|uniref:CRISPR-associated endonuclease Cas1 n=1 Tax=Clostridium sp. TaxID=1506 RepID=UPI003F34C634